MQEFVVAVTCNFGVCMETFLKILSWWLAYINNNIYAHFYVFHKSVLVNSYQLIKLCSNLYGTIDGSIYITKTRKKPKLCQWISGEWLTD